MDLQIFVMIKRRIVRYLKTFIQYFLKGNMGLFNNPQLLFYLTVYIMISPKLQIQLKAFVGCKQFNRITNLKFKFYT